MLNYSEIFDFRKTTLPLSKADLSKLLAKKSFMGYVQCPYNHLIETLKEISEAEQYQVSINPQQLYQNGVNPFNHAEVVIQVEGLRSYDEFVDRIISSEDGKEWTDFMTYSETFKSEVRALKLATIKKYLWNAANINNWFDEGGIKLPPARKFDLIDNFEEFKKTILTSEDLYRFIDACDEGMLKQAAQVLSLSLVKMLDKYRPQLNHHIMNNTRREPSILIKNPVINRIFIVSNFARQCEKDWPKIKFTSLDRRSFESISLWNEGM